MGDMVRSMTDGKDDEGRDCGSHSGIGRCSDDGENLGEARDHPKRECGVDEMLGAPVPSVLISIELDLGFSTATISVATWQTRNDFDAIVNSFLQENNVKLVFAEALVNYLEEVEREAVSFP